jgi:4-aminobutyrate aminotransferase-like enzyme
VTTSDVDESIDVIGRLEAASTSVPVGREFALVLDDASGSTVRDTRGREYLDLTAGLGAHALGHGAPAVTAAMHAQLDRIVHGGWLLPTTARRELLERLAKVVGIEDPVFLFTVTGSEAVEAALKAVRLATGRYGVWAFSGGFHGKTAGSLELTASPGLRAGVLGAGAGLLRLPYPADPALGGGPSAADCLGWIETALTRDDFPRDEVAGIVVEPVQGGRMTAPPAGFLRGLRALTEAHGLLLVLDEIFAGVGRTGRFFGFEHDGITPDVVVLGKALGGGLPIGVVAASREVLDRVPPYKQTSTFAGHPLACAAGVAVLSALADGSVIRGVAEREARFRTRLAQLDSSLAGGPFRLAVTGRGLMLGVRVLADDPAAAVAVANRVKAGLTARGALALVAGSTIKVTPPLTIKLDEVDAACERLSDAVFAERDRAGG